MTDTRHIFPHTRTRRLSQQLRRLHHELLEPRQLLTAGAISGAVFEELNADGIRNAGEPALPDWIVTLERTDTPNPALTLYRADPGAR